MVLDSRDPALTGGEQQGPCLKTCGSKRCKTSIKGDSCPGINSAACVADEEKLPGDKAHATAWLKHGHGDTEWLNRHGDRVPKSHLAITSSLMPRA